MPFIKIISSIDAVNDGPRVLKPLRNKKWGDSVFLSQGSLDGACGPYCLIMALISLGVVKYNKITTFPKPQSGVEKLLYNEFNNYPTLFNRGTNRIQLKKIVERVFKGEIHTEIYHKTQPENIQQIKEKIKNDIPVIVGIDFEGGDSHWILAIGLDCDDEKFENPIRLLALDPSGYFPTVSYWNCVIELIPVPNLKKFKYRWYGNYESRVKISECLSLWREHNFYIKE